MQIEVLGCAGAIATSTRTSTFLLNGDTLIDAGTGVMDMSLEAQQGIHQVFITHAHFDHIAGLPLLADSIARYRQEHGLGPLKVYALQHVLDAMKAHIFNNQIWPDFTALPSQAPTLRFVPIDLGSRIAFLDGRVIEVLPAVHSVPAVGYVVINHGQAWIYTGDTGRNPWLWKRINQLQKAGVKVRHLVIEATFASQEQEFADLTGHLTIGSLAQELTQLEQGGFDICLTHIKPRDHAAIEADMHLIEAIAREKQCRIIMMDGGMSLSATWAL